MTTKREKLKQELHTKETQLADAINALTCDCPCHKNSEIMHFMACCAGVGVNIPLLEKQISVLKTKLRL